jgi:hypothetical protein
VVIRRPKLREVIRDVPNFRDHGMMVDRALLKIVANLQRRHGEAWASEAGLRHMIAQDTGHMPGVSTVPKALDRLERAGILVHRELRRGKVLPDGDVCRLGTVLIYLPQNRAARRALAARARRQNDPDPYRVRPRAPSDLADVRKEIARAVEPHAPDEREQAAARARQQGTAALAELAAQWERETPGKLRSD